MPSLFVLPDAARTGALPMAEEGLETAVTRKALSWPSAAFANQLTNGDEELLAILKNQDQARGRHEVNQSKTSIKPSTDAGGSSKMGKTGQQVPKKR